MSKKRWFIGTAVFLFWVVVVCILYQAAQGSVTLSDQTEPREFDYDHPAGIYRVHLTGTWQVAQADGIKLVLCNVAQNSTIEILPEIGGYDYYPLLELAGNLQKSLTDTFGDWEFGEIEEGGSYRYEAVTFLALPVARSDTLALRASIMWVEYGLRCYVWHTFPADLDAEIIGEGMKIVASLEFHDLASLYEKYL